MSTTRLRKSFHYPADNSEDDDTPLALDEEGRSSIYFLFICATNSGFIEQEKLIEKLRKENAERNEEYLVFFRNQHTKWNL